MEGTGRAGEASGASDEVKTQACTAPAFRGMNLRDQVREESRGVASNNQKPLAMCTLNPNKVFSQKPNKRFY